MMVSVRVSPNSKKAAVEKTGETVFRVNVDAHTEDGKANKRLVEILSDYFGVPRSSVRIVRELTGRSKLVEIAQ